MGLLGQLQVIFTSRCHCIVEVLANVGRLNLKHAIEINTGLGSGAHQLPELSSTQVNLPALSPAGDSSLIGHVL